ncbi:MAG TPA: M14 family zinc carboxypeptidase [Steroidobacteraceae bacterium]|nr:M14 family zinc carboxypeptidase [Steroidobacteraceae bacterium]
MNTGTHMNSTLATIAEQSGFTQTGRTDEVDRLCAAMAARWPEAVSAFEFGLSAEGRPMRALIASRSGALSAQDLHARGTPILMVQAGIHPGESDGKDAGFIALRELLSGAAASGVIEHIALLFVPAFNTDGHERLGRWNRPNQNGPEITGSRATAENLNLNRDYTKADAPEMQALLALISEWDPLICADLHVTDGADFEPDVSIQVEPVNQGDPQLHPSGIKMRDELIAKLARQGSLPLPFYPDLFETDNPESGFVLTVYSPRFSTGYFPQRNRFTVLVETHSWKPYAKRVQVMRNTIVGLAELAAEHGPGWLAQARAADVSSRALGGSRLCLDYESSWREPSTAGKTTAGAGAGAGDADLIEFRGYAYTRRHSAISGGLVTIYDPATPQIWRVPYRHRIEPSIAVDAPRMGYFIPQAYAETIGLRLKRHGIKLAPVPADMHDEALQQFRATRVSFAKRPFEGRMRADILGEWQPADDAIAAPALFVPISQPLARLIAALLEPRAPDSFAAWGFFNACFEQKEQLEPYVAEQIAREIHASNPKLRAEFESRLENDAAFRADPAARLEFFCRHHASWDRQLNLYPIFRA